MDKLILSTAYIPPISYFRLLASADLTCIEMCENYIKQTYRNRCVIHSANGPLQLSVPVERGSFHKVHIKDIRIDYLKKWQRLHLRALEAAYNSSAYYEFFIDEIRSVVNQGHVYLVDLNFEITRLINAFIGINPNILITESFESHYTDANDRRYNLTPKGAEGLIESKDVKYFQVFSAKNGFIPDLSIIDLLFNMGPETYRYLKS